MNPLRRLGRHLSFAKVVSCLALFAALGGSAYAASQVNGSKIVKESIGAGKLKPGTLTSKQVKKGSLDSSVIDVASLTTVPSAQSAVSAQTASSADTAQTANTATSATSAGHATSADSATNAGHATTADSAETAANATNAAHADEADAVDGSTATDLTVACPTETELFIGMCWDETEHFGRSWPVAIEECAEAGGRLPTVAELVAYAELLGPKVHGQNWSGEVESEEGGETVLTVDTFGRHTDNTLPITFHIFRCVFLPTNAG